MKILFTTLLIVITTSLYSQNIEWETNLGGSGTDSATSIQQTADNGYIIAGYSWSNDGDISENNGDDDIWIVKLDGTGSLVWETNLGGSSWDEAYSIQQTIDGGFVVAGFSWSNNGDVSENNGGYDFWIVKLDDLGSLVWETNLGGSSWEVASSIQQTIDEGYIIAGYTTSNDGDVSENNGADDFWIVKLDVNGSLVWEKSLGGSGFDNATSIQQTADGGYIVAGASNSSNGDVGGNYGNYDYWIVKLDINGTLVWENNFGGSNEDWANYIQQTTDGGYIMVGWSKSSDFDVSGNNGRRDYWVVKLDSNGVLVWEKNLGGSYDDIASSIQQTFDGGYIIAGFTSSTDGDINENNGGDDYWIVKLSATGSLIFETNLGGSGNESARSIKQTNNGEYIVLGSSNSNNGDVGGNNGVKDYWVVKLEGTLGIEDNIASKISLSPNPTTNTITIANLSQEITKIELLDMQGRIVLSKNEVINNTINISHLQSANYLVKIYVGRTIFYKKVIKK
ncbi:MAG: T9SS type A sorting domain-containing protein [Flavobacteriaceae bacterium]|nr:T9SS type A sorting domain-containing protein [Flavobacteriaceae bacterium]